jgi:DNA-binding FadR family transcriptional regulator
MKILSCRLRGVTVAEEGLRVPRAADVVADHLRRQIVRGELPEGRSLPPEEQLLARFKVSGPTLRAAYRVLESEGLVRVHRGARGGATVRKPAIGPASRYVGLLLQADGTTVADLFEARVLLEPGLARAVALRRTPAVVADLRGHVERERTALDDPVELAQATTAFHAALAAHAGNHTVAVLLGLLRELFEKDALDALAGGRGVTPAERRSAQRAHQRLTDLIDDGDGDGAESHWRRYLTRVGAAYAARYGETAVYELLT